MTQEGETLPTDDAWKEVRGLLKAAIVAGEIPLEPRKMRPKEVYDKYLDATTIDYNNKKSQEKFTRMLRGLRAKHMNGDLEKESESKAIEWSKSAAKQVIRAWFRDGTLSTTFTDKKDLQKIWEDHCRAHAAFKKMKYDEAFIRRIQSVRDDHLKKVKRSEEDLAAYTVAKLNHPTPELNGRGEPKWNGSEAQKQLKELIAKQEHVGKEPRELWTNNNEFQKYGLKSFRDHIYQEQRLQKFQNYVEQLKQAKIAALQY